MENLLTVEEASQKVRLSPWTLRRYICEKKIPVVRLGRRTFFDPEDLEKWVETRKVASLE